MLFDFKIILLCIASASPVYATSNMECFSDAHRLVRHHEEAWQRARLAEYFVNEGQQAKAFSYLSALNRRRDLSMSEQCDVIRAWEKLLGTQSLEPLYHLGLARAYEAREVEAFARAHYLQAAYLVRDSNPKLAARITAKVATLTKFGSSREPWSSDLYAGWQPSVHHGRLLTRCTVSCIHGKEIVGPIIDASSGSTAEDESVLAAVKRIEPQILRDKTGIYEFLFVSGGDEKLVLQDWTFAVPVDENRGGEK